MRSRFSRSLLFLLSILLLSACKTVSVQPDETLRQELLVLVKADQAVMGKSAAEINVVLGNQVARLKLIIKKHGWPSISLVGKDGAQAAWLMAQHADFDVPFQRSVLSMMEKLAEDKDVNLDNLAYLRDRVAINEGNLQIYGTQGACNGKTYEPFPLRDGKSVDLQRSKMEMNPLQSYVEFASKVMCSER